VMISDGDEQPALSESAAMRPELTDFCFFISVSCHEG